MFQTSTTYEHGRSQVELVEELCDEDVHLEHVCHVFVFNVAQDVDEPLEVTMRRADPEEVNLLTRNAGVPVKGGLKLGQ